MLVTVHLVGLGIVTVVTFVKAKGWGFIPLAILALSLTVATWIYVPQGHVGVISQFGITQVNRVIPEGTFVPFGIYPWQDVEAIDVRVDNLDFHGSNHFVGRTKDPVGVTIELTLPIRVNPNAVPWLLTKYKAGWKQFVLPYVSASLKDAVAAKTWREVYQSDRAGVAALFVEDLKKNLSKILQENGIPADVAESAFILSDPQIGSVELPHEIEDSLHKQSAVTIDQQTSILRAQVAENDVKTREAEGRGYSSLLTSLPTNVPASEAASMMSAQARLKTVQLLDDAIKAGKIKDITFVIEGGTPPSVPTGK